MALVSQEAAAQAQAKPTQVKPGFNIFSVEQDVEIGRQSAQEAERQLPLLNDRSVEDYVNRIIRELAQAAPGARYPYQLKVVNASDINAFTLPGGFMYVNRGLIEAARNEGELAGVLAHEMAHVALRHGTHQASKAYLTQAGLGILGGVIGGKGRSTSQIINVIGGLGLNAVFLKFSRDAEHQADTVGAQILHRSGYDPMGMATFFDFLQAQRRSNPGRVEQFFSSHPPPADRAARIRRETQALGPVRGGREVGGFERARAELRGMSPAASMQQIARSGSRAPQRGSSGGRVTLNVPPPSTRLRTFEQRHGFFSIQYPENWRPYASDNGLGVTIVPEGGVVQGQDGQQSIVYGVIVNHYDPFEGSPVSRGSSLEQATNDLIQQVTRSNPHLRATSRSRRRQTIDGAPALSSVLSGRSPITGEEERVTVFTRELPDDHVIYSLFIAPGRDYTELSRTFSRMVETLRVNDSVAHR